MISMIFNELPKPTLAVLGRTCKTLSDSALDKLWEDMLSIVPLCKCLPNDVWKEDDEGKLVSRF
jgi:hypothetical protein